MGVSGFNFPTNQSNEFHPFTDSIFHEIRWIHGGGPPFSCSFIPYGGFLSRGGSPIPFIHFPSSYFHRIFPEIYHPAIDPFWVATWRAGNPRMFRPGWHPGSGEFKGPVSLIPTTGAVPWTHRNGGVLSHAITRHIKTPCLWTYTTMGFNDDLMMI